jgi:hypothetical protein
MKLLEALHVNDNSLAPNHDDPESDKLQKLGSLTKLLNEYFNDECVTFILVNWWLHDKVQKEFSTEALYATLASQEMILNGNYMSQCEVYTGRQAELVEETCSVLKILSETLAPL